jgi:hypothetical protein
MIYRRAEELGEVDKLLEIVEPQHWSKSVRPRRLEIEPIDLMEELKGTKKVIEHLGV